ncbi:hypothetical protein TCAL_14549 [Tigriopus californicus]|uniref:Uncharacterized protein n=1 Tax=Tigriopus californicus TaxID=6832 RepID=A0A553PAM5_TIGCA|nr:hypothetical protein TCAL_14549 [Tigriopus californicus]
MRVFVLPYNDAEKLCSFSNPNPKSEPSPDLTWGRVKQCQFFTILFVCVGILIFQASQCVIKYLDASTGTGDKYVHVARTSFPVMTICPSYPYKLDRLQYHGIMTKSDIQFNSQWTSNDSTVDPVTFYEDIVVGVEEIVEDILIYAEVPINGTNSFMLYGNSTFCGQGLFQIEQYYYNGDCYALELPDCLVEAGVLEIVFDFRTKTDIFIHHKGQFLSPNARYIRAILFHDKTLSMRPLVVQFLMGFEPASKGSGTFQCMGTCHGAKNTFSSFPNKQLFHLMNFYSRSRVDVDTGHFVKIAVNHEVVQLLGDDGSCVNVKIDYDTCIYQTLRDLMLAQVGCTVPWLPDKSKICIVEEDRKNVTVIYQANRRNQKNICPNSCLFTNMYFGPPVTGMANEEESNIGRAIFYFRRDIKTTTEYFLYSPLSMLAEIGGYVGLLLGMSLFKLTEMNNILIDWYMTKSARDKC